jgi:tetratricopeptide (TPR) repeat protein
LPPGTVTLIVGGTAEARAVAARRVAAERHATKAFDDRGVASWAFRRHPATHIPPDADLIRVHDLHEAFPSGQTGATRLVLTQSTYQVQRWLDWLDGRGGRVHLVGDADYEAMRRNAPEAFSGRGPWAHVTLIEVSPDRTQRAERSEGRSRRDDLLIAAFRTTDPGERLALCRRANDADPADLVVTLALGSALMEVQDLDASQAAIETAIEMDRGWEASFFEYGKLWLRRDDLERASVAFAEAGRLMPSFSAAFSNLGATLGELGRTDDALRAFQQALAYDPDGYTVLNNVGVVSRELGRLAESEAAFRKVVTLEPDFVFGHYNLGHTLFLQGRYQAALAAYSEGQRRDPEKNARQAARLAIVRLAAGDADGALGDLQRHTRDLPRDLKREIFVEAQEILWALLTDQPSLAGWRRVADFVKAELAALG